MTALLHRFEVFSDPPAKQPAYLPCMGQGKSKGKFLAGAVVKAIRDARLKRGDAIVIAGIYCDAGRFKELIALEDKDQVIEYRPDHTGDRQAVILSRVNAKRNSYSAMTRIIQNAWLKEIRWIKDEWNMSRPVTDIDQIVNRIAALV